MRAVLAFLVFVAVGGLITDAIAIRGIRSELIATNAALTTNLRVTLYLLRRVNSLERQIDQRAAKRRPQPIARSNG